MSRHPVYTHGMLSGDPVELGEIDYGIGHGWFSYGETITELLHRNIRGHLDLRHPDAVLNIETHCFNVTLHAQSCVYDLDVGQELWLNRQRWSRLIKEYVSREALELFVEQAQYIYQGNARKGATAVMRFRDPVRSEKKHRWGGCLQCATFRGENSGAHPPTITFYSRTTYMGYIGFLDAAIAHVLAKLIGEPGLIHFRWVLTDQQVHCFKTLPFIFSQADLFRRLGRHAAARRAKPKAPAWLHCTKWYRKILEAYEEHGPEDMLALEKYGPFRRIKRRWLEHVHPDGVTHSAPPSLKVTELDFDKAV